MKLASARGDVSFILRKMSSAAALKPADYIKKTVGSLLYTYYTYVKEFRVRPVDMEDLVDGLLYIMARNYQQERERLEHEEARSTQKR